MKSSANAKERRKIRAAERQDAVRHKPICIYVFSLVSIAIFPVSMQLAMDVFASWRSLIAALLLIASAVILHFVFKRNASVQCFSFILSAFANGVSASALYLHLGVRLSLSDMYLSAALAVLLLLLPCLAAYMKPKLLGVIAIGETALMLLLSVLGVVLRYALDSHIYGFASLVYVIAAFFSVIFYITVRDKRRSVFRDLGYASFGVFAIITAIVIVIISEGDAIDGFDIGIDRRKKK